ncbi:hypothetical protein AB0L82_26225 [Nocardia sp. NPDC052001]|uniref:hypothetical protein n=1 Tax=Nocardia sp. NPDC052001 TaxID=3154853 RepID=UPI003424BE9E
MDAQGPIKNLRLKAVMDEAGVKNKSLARLMQAYQPPGGKPQVRTSHTNIGKYLRREIAQPSPSTCEVMCAVLSGLVGRPISNADLGFEEAATSTPSVGTFSYPATAAQSFSDLEGLTRLRSGADLLVYPQAWSELLVKAMFGTEPGNVVEIAGRVGEVEVQAARDALAMFSSFDYRYGGGQSKLLVARFLETAVLPRVRFASPESSLGHEYLCIAAALTRLAGWTAYDVGEHGLAQRYLTHGFRLAKAAGDRALCGRMLAGMSHQANFLGHYDDAVHLARGAQHISAGFATPTAMALFHAMEARGLASCGDQKGTAAALAAAEEYLLKREPQNDPDWIKYFDESELHAEMAHCFRDLDRPELAINFAQSSLAEVDGLYVRSSLFVRTVFATAQIQARELDQAVDAARLIVDAVSELNSHRLVCYVADFNSRLRRSAGSVPLADSFSDYAFQKLGSKGFPAPLTA